jgi:hypothetical protein
MNCARRATGASSKSTVRGQSTSVDPGQIMPLKHLNGLIDRLGKGFDKEVDHRTEARL